MAVEIRFIAMITVKYVRQKKLVKGRGKKRKQVKAATKENTNTTTKDQNEYYRQYFAGLSGTSLTSRISRTINKSLFVPFISVPSLHCIALYITNTR